MLATAVGAVGLPMIGLILLGAAAVFFCFQKRKKKNKDTRQTQPVLVQPTLQLPEKHLQKLDVFPEKYNRAAQEVLQEYLTANILANILGLGWAATPMGLKAMMELAPLERERLASEMSRREGRQIDPDEIRLTKASDEMCTFLVLNISSLQVIPVSVIAYRAQYGAVNPAAIVVPGLIATTVSTAVAVIFCRIMCRRGERE